MVLHANLRTFLVQMDETMESAIQALGADH